MDINDVQVPQKASADTSTSTFELSISKIFSFVKNKDLLRYMPDDMLKDSQKELEQSKKTQGQKKYSVDNNSKIEHNNTINRGENYGERKQDTSSGRNAGIPGSTFTSVDSRVEKRFSPLDGRKNYRGIESTLKNILTEKGEDKIF